MAGLSSSSFPTVGGGVIGTAFLVNYLMNGLRMPFPFFLIIQLLRFDPQEIIYQLKKVYTQNFITIGLMKVKSQI